MCSRVIIEQQLADLELALCRQEELISSQREAIKGLRELITLEYAGKWKQTTASTSSSDNGGTTSNSGKRSNVEVDSPVAGTVTTTGDPAKKRKTTVSSNTGVVGSLTSFSQELNSFATPATSRYPALVSASSSGGSSSKPPMPAPLSPTRSSIRNGGSVKKRRAIEKVQQLIALLPPFGSTFASSSSKSISAETVPLHGSTSIVKVPSPIKSPMKKPPAAPKAPKIDAIVKEQFDKLHNIERYFDQLESLKEINVLLKVSQPYDSSSF
jgi:hypothetical protein